MAREIAKHIIAIIMFILGWYLLGWKIGFGVFLMFWSHNIGRHLGE